MRRLFALRISGDCGGGGDVQDWFSNVPGISHPSAVHPTWMLNHVFSTLPAAWPNGSRPLILHR